MKPTSKLLIFVITFLALAASAYAQSPREDFQAAVAAYQQYATEANVEKLAELYKQVTPPPAVPEQAEFHAQKGGAFVRLAKTPADYERAAKEFQAAINLAPWISEYHYNLAICYKSAEQFNPALASLKFAQILARDDKERRDALGLRAEIEAAQEMAASQKVEQDKVAAAAVQKAQEQKERPQAIVQQLQSKYGNRRVRSKLICMISDGRTVLKCNESEARGTTWTPGVRDGSYSWMPIQTPAGSLDFTSFNNRYSFRLETGEPNRIVLTAVNNGEGSDWFCGLLKGAEITDIEWKDCDNGSARELRFGATSDGRPMIDIIQGCDAARNCVRDRRELE